MSDQQAPAPFSIQNAAAAEMIHNNFRIGFAPEVEEQVAAIRRGPSESPNDCKCLLWSSIDNDTSRDLDQVEYAEQTADGIRILIGIADVAGTVARDSPIDRHAADQTLTVYTAVHNFPMLPLELSTDLTSLNEDQPRSAVVVEFTVTPDGQRIRTRIYEAEVQNHAQLAYSKVGPWLEGTANADAKVARRCRSAGPAQAAGRGRPRSPRPACPQRSTRVQPQ